MTIWIDAQLRHFRISRNYPKLTKFLNGEALSEANKKTLSS